MNNDHTTRLRPLWKRIAIWLLERPFLNIPLVSMLKHLNWPPSRERLPVMRGVGEIKLPNDNTVTLLTPARCNVAREIWWHDGELGTKADKIALDLAISLSDDTDVFLDVGSYSGLFALSVARCNPSIHCHAFEIVPQNFQLLWANVIQNDLIARISVHLTGASNERGTMLSPKSFEAGLLPSSVSLDSVFENGVSIPVDRLDAILPERDIKLVMKIDVEGFEWGVLSGASDLIESARPDIICEFLTRAPDLPAVQKYLTPLGYRFFRITDDGLVEANEIVPVKTERDWLLTTRNNAELERHAVLLPPQNL